MPELVSSVGNCTFKRLGQGLVGIRFIVMHSLVLHNADQLELRH